MNGRYAQYISNWTECSTADDSKYLACSSRWIQEDAELSCNVVYRDEFGRQITNDTGFNISEPYYNTRMDTVELRLIQGGVRLAAVINEIVNSGAMLPQLSSSLLNAFISIFVATLINTLS